MNPFTRLIIASIVLTVSSSTLPVRAFASGTESSSAGSAREERRDEKREEQREARQEERREKKRKSQTTDDQGTTKVESKDTSQGQ